MTIDRLIPTSASEADPGKAVGLEATKLPLEEWTRVDNHVKVMMKTGGLENA